MHRHEESIDMGQLATIEVAKEYLKFSAAHFTVFSATERERLHGHNYSVSATVTAPVDANGLCFSYGEMKSRMRALCDALDEYTLIAAESPHLHIREEGDYYRVAFNDEVMWLLQSDTLLLPIRNATVEEFSRYLLAQLRQDAAFFEAYHCESVAVTVYSGPGQSATAWWQAGAG